MFDAFLSVVIVILAILLLVLLLRAIIGPTIADRLVAINMIGTITIMIICILAVKMKETFLGDVPLVYAIVSFVAVVTLAKIYIGVSKMADKKDME